MFVRLAHCIGLSTAVAFIAFAMPARASDRDPVIVVPGRPGIPIMQNGRDISYTVVEGDWGLERPGAMTATIFGTGWQSVPGAVVPNYFPSTGKRPRLGRVEIEPNGTAPMPRRAESFERNWSANSDPLPASLDPPQNPPAIIYAPREGRERRMPGGR